MHVDVNCLWLWLRRVWINNWLRLTRCVGLHIHDLGSPIGNGDIGVYSVHLKSNLITHGDREKETAKNIQKREVAITQLLTHVHDVIGTTMPSIIELAKPRDSNLKPSDPL